MDVNRELNNILKKTDLFNSVVQDILVISDNGYYFTTIGQDGLAANYDYWSKAVSYTHLVSRQISDTLVT